MKFIFLSFALSCSAVSAMSFAVDESSVIIQNAGKNWTEEFTLADGSTILHTPSEIMLNGENARLLPNAHFTNIGIMSSGQSMHLNFSDMNGHPVKAPLIVTVDSTRNEFVIALMETGLYTGTPDEQEMYQEIGNWACVYNLNALQLTHTPHSIIYEDSENGRQEFKTALTVNNVNFKVKCSKESFETQIKELIVGSRSR